MTKFLRRLARDAYIKVPLRQELVWRHLLNRSATRDYRIHTPSLGAEATRVLDDLNRNGAARSTLGALTGDPALLGVLQAEAARLEECKADEIADRMRRLDAAEDLGNGKDTKMFVVTLLDHDRPVIEPDGVLAKLVLDAELKGIADSYFGMRTCVADVNIWRNMPVGDKEPTASQLWHRDLPDDHFVLKAFVYLEDVADASGPFSYVVGTHGKGRRAWKPRVIDDGYNLRASDSDMAAATKEEERCTFIGPAGTILFADTIGWHKGGQAKTKPRFVIQMLYSSHAALPDRKLGAPEGLDKAHSPASLRFDFKTGGSRLA